MQKPAGEIVLSASDLSFFAECAHRTWLDRLHLDRPMVKAEDDEQAKLIQGKGYEHEQRFFATLKEGANSYVEIGADWPLERKLEATRAAILRGAEVIYQVTLKRGSLMGHADFLVRSSRGSRGQWLYEVADTKLARSTKAKFLLQLCFYSDLLSDVTGEHPHHMHVELGNGKRESFRVGDYFHYYRSLLARLLSYLAAYPDATEVPYPVPCDHCSLCPWRERCAAKRIKDDHLSAVAGITRQQIARLEAADVRTVAALGALPATQTVPRIVSETLCKLRVSGHECPVFKWPKTRETFWREKISRNQSNDRKAVETLIAAGWRVAVIWECALRKRPEEIATLVHCLGNWLRGVEPHFEQ